MKNYWLLFAFVLGLPLATQAAFPDVPTSHPHAEAINYLKSEGVVAGNPDGTYKPAQSISRAAFTKIIIETYFGVQMAQQCSISTVPFSDVAANVWYTPYICLAYEKGLIKGYEDGTFRPGATINVAEAAKIISAHRKGARTGNPWFKPYLEDLGEAGALPEEVQAIDQVVNRGIMAEIIYRLKANKQTKPHRKYSYFFPEEKVTEDKMMIKIPTGTFHQAGILAPVDGSGASGNAKARLSDGKYTLVAHFENLVDPGEGYFYEGWIVRETNGLSVISTGKAEKHNGRYVNVYETSEDLSDHLFYVLTIEPDDGDPAPADHVVEGRLTNLAAHTEDKMMKKMAVNEDFSYQRFDTLVANGDKFVLNFQASWCPNCQKLERKINDQISELPEGTVILKVDYDTYADLKKKYGVTHQTTGVFFDAGKVVKTKPGLSFDDIKNFF